MYSAVINFLLSTAFSWYIFEFTLSYKVQFLFKSLFFLSSLWFATASLVLFDLCFVFSVGVLLFLISSIITNSISNKDMVNIFRNKTKKISATIGGGNQKWLSRMYIDKYQSNSESVGKTCYTSLSKYIWDLETVDLHSWFMQFRPRSTCSV